MRTYIPPWKSLAAPVEVSWAKGGRRDGHKKIRGPNLDPRIPEIPWNESVTKAYFFPFLAGFFVAFFPFFLAAMSCCHLLQADWIDSPRGAC